MTDDSKLGKLCHTIESRANSLKEAAKLLGSMSPEERREITRLMRAALKK